MSVAALLAAIDENSGFLTGTPLDYGSNLLFFVDDQQNIVVDPGAGEGGRDAVLSWTDQGPNGISFTVPATDARSPELEEDSIIVPDGPNINGISFEQSPTQQDRKLFNDDDVLDSIFSGGTSFDRTFGFAARIDILNSVQTSQANSLLSKGFHRGTGGHVLDIVQDGTIRFRKRRDDGSIFECRANGFYSNGDLVLGRFEWNGAAATGSARFRLYNGSEFVTVGSVTSAGSGGIGGASTSPWVIGNSIDNTDLTFDACFQGTVYAMWATKPGQTQFDEQYLSRFIT